MTAKVQKIARQEKLPSLRNLILAGVDEAGRGALAGPVAAAAVILPPRHRLHECRDSKIVPPEQRSQLAEQIKQQALFWAFAVAEVNEIVKKNILQASLLAMKRALQKLRFNPDVVMVDGPHAPPIMTDCYAVVGGDARVKAISCASILAKVMRDELMRALHCRYPQYGFAQNKGYTTARHLLALKRHGACRHHRRSFAPVRELTRPNHPGDNGRPTAAEHPARKRIHPNHPGDNGRLTAAEHPARKRIHPSHPGGNGRLTAAEHPARKRIHPSHPGRAR